jgi:tetratricopeptide (TPR) repeat protein
MPHHRAVALIMLLAIGASADAGANEVSQRLRERASAALFNLDEMQAVEAYRSATVADPQDPAAFRGLASALLVRIAMRRGTMTVDSYLGRVARSDVALAPPPPDLARDFHAAADRAIALARAAVARHPTDPQAHYELGAAVGVRASYLATVDGGILAALRAARESFNEHERVLDAGPSRHDAGLIVGMYRYVVSVMSAPVRWMAYVAGFGGGREQGLRLVEQAAAYPGENRSDAQLALVLLYTRERQYDLALRQVDDLRARYPRNRLLVLEHGSTLLRAGRAEDAERSLTAGIAQLAGDARPRMFGEEALWYYRRGTARAQLGRSAEARSDLRHALEVEGRGWVHGRSHFELGALAWKDGDAASARQHFQDAARLGDADHDSGSADRARARLREVSRQP